jgi:DNA-binding CsgD family transcriptional regulator
MNAKDKLTKRENEIIGLLNKGLTPEKLYK